MQKSSALLLTFLAANLTVWVSSQTAQAAGYDDPFGNDPSEAFINKDPDDGNLWINWRNKNTGACDFHHIGDSNGLFDNSSVFGFGGNDTITVVNSSSPISFCGFNMVSPPYGGNFLDIWAGSGDDVVWAPDVDTQMFGDVGNDYLSSGRWNTWLIGQEGNDTLIAWASSGPGAEIKGYDGNDCVRINPGLSPSVQHCGDGVDTWYGPGTRPASCESTSAACCPGEIC